MVPLERENKKRKQNKAGQSDIVEHFACLIVIASLPDRYKIDKNLIEFKTV